MITTDLARAKQLLDEHKIIAIPTETVYGLAGNAFCDEAVEKIFALKKRPHFNPLIAHLKSSDALRSVAREIPEIAQMLADEFWPGPLTLVLKKQSHVPDLVTAGKDTVAVRVPNHPVALKLLSTLDYPLAAPSANPFGSISPTSAAHVHAYFGENVEVILDGGECERGIESTIIGFEGNQPILYRLGSLSVEQIEKKVGAIFTKTLSEDNTPEAPGMLSRHYAPRTPTYLTNDIQGFLRLHPGKKMGLLLFQNRVDSEVVSQEILSKTGDLAEAAKNLYAAMHRLDKLDLEMIVAERLPDTGLGKTLNDKLERATK